MTIRGPRAIPYSEERARPSPCRTWRSGRPRSGTCVVRRDASLRLHHARASYLSTSLHVHSARRSSQCPMSGRRSIRRLADSCAHRRAVAGSSHACSTTCRCVSGRNRLIRIPLFMPAPWAFLAQPVPGIHWTRYEIHSVMVALRVFRTIHISLFLVTHPTRECQAIFPPSRDKPCGQTTTRDLVQTVMLVYMCRKGQNTEHNAMSAWLCLHTLAMWRHHLALHNTWP